MSTSGGRPAAGGATRASSCSRLAPPPSACAAPTAESDTPARPSAAPPNPPVGHTLVTAESLVSETPGLTHTRLRSPRLRASRRLGSSTLARSWLPQQPHRQRQGASAGSTCSAGLVARAALRRYSCCAATKPAHSPRKKTRYRSAVLRVTSAVQRVNMECVQRFIVSRRWPTPFRAHQARQASAGGKYAHDAGHERRGCPRTSTCSEHLRACCASPASPTPRRPLLPRSAQGSHCRCRQPASGLT